jgi:hypothetical protein
MQHTVDRACGAVPRTLANIIEDARRVAGEADARPPGVLDVWIARLAGQGSRLDRRERRRGAEPFRRLPRSRPRAPGGDCRRDAWRPARASVRLPRPLGRIRSPDAHALGSMDQLVPAEDCEAAVAFRTAGEI